MKLLLIITFITVSLFASYKSGLSKYSSEINQSIKSSSGTQQAILKNALKFVEQKKIIVGSCWDYINAIYKESNATRVRIFSSKKAGPYANIDAIKPGDWLYHINHSYHNIEHSGLFITWLDKNRTKALMLSYAGEHKKNPARFRAYDINNTYQIMRAKETTMEYISLKEYAKRHKISLFNTIKLSKSGKVDTITKTIDGKEQVFIKADATVNTEENKTKEPTIAELYKEIEKLKERIKKLEQRLK